MNPTLHDKITNRFRSIQDKTRNDRENLKGPPVPIIHIGMASCGIASGALETKKAFEEALAERKIEARIHSVGCIGHCYGEPVVIIENPGFPRIFYHQVTPGKAGMLVKSFLEEGDPLFEHLLGAMDDNEMIPSVMDFPRFNKETRAVMDQCGLIDPEDINDYILEGGYSALVKAIQRPAEDSIQAQGYSKIRLKGKGRSGIPHREKVDACEKRRGR